MAQRKQDHTSGDDREMYCFDTYKIHVCRVGVIVMVWDMDMVRVMVELTG